MRTLTTWADIEHFKPREFLCQCNEPDCNSDGTEMNIHFVAKLDRLRALLGFPLRVTSGYRCPAYNQKISTTGADGPHTTGHAADVSINGENAHSLIRLAASNFSGVGVNQRGDYAKRFIHLDDLETPEHPRPRIWTY